MFNLHTIMLVAGSRSVQMRDVRVTLRSVKRDVRSVNYDISVIVNKKIDGVMDALNNKIDDGMDICDRRATATNCLVAAGVRVLMQRSNFTDGRLNQVEDKLMTRLAQMEVKMDMQTEELQKFKMAVTLMGGMLWFNVLTLVLITWTFVFWSLGFMKGLAAIIPPVHGVTDRSDVQMIQDGFVYMSKSVGNWLVMNLLKEVRDEAHL